MDKQPDTVIDFKETVTEFWLACGDRTAWQSGLVERLAKNLMFLATQPNCPNWNQTQFEAAMSNYTNRKIIMGLT